MNDVINNIKYVYELKKGDNIKSFYGLKKIKKIENYIDKIMGKCKKIYFYETPLTMVLEENDLKVTF